MGWRVHALSSFHTFRTYMQGPGAAELRARSCGGACTRDTPTISGQELQQLLKATPSWSLAADGTAITRAFVAKNFVAAMAFLNKVAEVAEDAGHHPDLHLTNYREVQLVLSTHAIGGLSEHDFVLAARIDELPVEYSPKWLREQQEQQLQQ